MLFCFFDNFFIRGAIEPRLSLTQRTHSGIYFIFGPKGKYFFVFLRQLIENRDFLPPENQDFPMILCFRREWNFPKIIFFQFWKLWDISEWFWGDSGLHTDSVWLSGVFSMQILCSGADFHEKIMDFEGGSAYKGHTKQRHFIKKYVFFKDISSKHHFWGTLMAPECFLFIIRPYCVPTLRYSTTKRRNC